MPPVLYFWLPAFSLTMFGQIPGYRIDTVAGSSAAGDGAAATSALLMQAEGMAFDSKTTALHCGCKRSPGCGE